MRYSTARPDATIGKAIEDAKTMAKKEWPNQAYQGEFPDNGYGISVIRPYHIKAGAAAWGSSNYWASSYAASVTWEAWIDITQTDMAFEILTGYMNLQAVPKTVEVYIKADGREQPTLNIEEFYTYDVARLFWKAPVVISPSKAWSFYHKGTNTGVEREGLLGYTMGPRAFLILRG